MFLSIFLPNNITFHKIYATDWVYFSNTPEGLAEQAAWDIEQTKRKAIEWGEIIEWNGMYYYPDGTVSATPPAKSNSQSSKTATVSTPTPTPKPTPKPCAHDYVGTVTKNATCLEEGEMTLKCSICGDEKNETLPVLDTHEYVKDESKHVDSTCNTKGKDVYVCKICKKEYEEELPLGKHKYVEEITTNPTCQNEGIRTFECQYCNDSYEETIPVIDHDEGEWVVTKENSMFVHGEQVRKCTMCGENLETKEIPSMYPIQVLYILYGLLGVAVLGILIFVIRKMKNL